MLTTTVLGAGVGVGVWVMLRALRPRPTPLGIALAGLARAPSPSRTGNTPTSAEQHLGRIARRVVTAFGTNPGRYEPDLRVAGRTPTGHAVAKLVGATGGTFGPLLAWTGLAAAGVGLPFLAAAGLTVGGSVAGWILPDLTLKDRAEQRRRAFRHALSAYLDLVNIIIAGGGGIQTALYTAADAGDGWAFAAIRESLDRARLTQRSPWDCFAELANDLAVPELAELAASVALAGSHGARIRASLAAKADTLRGHQVAETEAAAESATERMTIPVAVLLFGFLVFIAWPAIHQITDVTGPVGP